MKKLLTFVLICLAAVTFTACVSAASAAPSAENTGTAVQRQVSSGSSQADQSAEKMLVVYFSQAGEQYHVGVVEEGNTSIVAHMIAEQTCADLFEIESAVPYPNTLDELLDVSEQEKTDNARPEIANSADLSGYNVVFIGYPIWWGDMPMIVYNFLESYDFNGKTIVPFCTHGGSGLAETERTISNITGANILDGLAITGTTAQNEREQTREAVSAWLKESGLIVTK